MPTILEDRIANIASYKELKEENHMVYVNMLDSENYIKHQQVSTATTHTNHIHKVAIHGNHCVTVCLTLRETTKPPYHVDRISTYYLEHENYTIYGEQNSGVTTLEHLNVKSITEDKYQQCNSDNEYL